MGGKPLNGCGLCSVSATGGQMAEYLARLQLPDDEKSETVVAELIDLATGEVFENFALRKAENPLNKKRLCKHLRELDVVVLSRDLATALMFPPGYQFVPARAPLGSLASQAYQIATSEPVKRMALARQEIDRKIAAKQPLTKYETAILDAVSEKFHKKGSGNPENVERKKREFRYVSGPAYARFRAGWS